MARILIVDDELVLAETLQAWLQEDGHDVQVAANARDAIAQMLDTRPELVLSDVMMPDMSGTALLMAIRENAILSQVPVILMSALPMHRAAGGSAGYAAFIRKPFPFQEMSELVRTVLDGGTPASE
jgi:DNA-binding response OmpR family regulator